MDDSCLFALAEFTPQGRCKPNAMELVPIAEAQTIPATKVQLFFQLTIRFGEFNVNFYAF